MKLVMTCGLRQTVEMRQTLHKKCPHCGAANDITIEPNLFGVEEDNVSRIYDCRNPEPITRLCLFCHKPVWLYDKDGNITNIEE